MRRLKLRTDAACPFHPADLVIPRARVKVGFLKVFCPASVPAGVGNVGPKGGPPAALRGEGPEGGDPRTRPSSTGGPWGRGGVLLLAGASWPSSCVSVHAVPAPGALAVEP